MDNIVRTIKLCNKNLPFLEQLSSTDILESLVDEAQATIQLSIQPPPREKVDFALKVHEFHSSHTIHSKVKDEATNMESTS